MIVRNKTAPLRYLYSKNQHRNHALSLSMPPKHRSLQYRVKALDNARYHGGHRIHLIDTIVMHCTAGASASSSMSWMNRLGPSGNPLPRNQVASYHYIIDRDGIIYRMAPVTLVAYHAGDSAFPADKSRALQGKSLNTRSIGIAWANLNNGEPLTEQQIESGLWLCKVWMDQAGVPLSRIVGHYEVSPGRKSDPKPAIAMSRWREMMRGYVGVA